MLSKPIKPQGGKAKNTHRHRAYSKPNTSPLGRCRSTGPEPKQYTPDSSLAPVWTSVNSHPLYGRAFLRVNIYLPHRKTEPDGGKEGAVEEKCCVFPWVLRYFFSKWFWFSQYVVCDFSTRKVQRNRNETDCTEFLKIKQKSRGSGSLTGFSLNQVKF